MAFLFFLIYFQNEKNSNVNSHLLIRVYSNSSYLQENKVQKYFTEVQPRKIKLETRIKGPNQWHNSWKSFAFVSAFIIVVRKPQTVKNIVPNTLYSYAWSPRKTDVLSLLCSWLWRAAQTFLSLSYSLA